MDDWHIKKQISLGSPKGKMLKNRKKSLVTSTPSPASGQTNATSPKRMEAIQTAFGDMMEAKNREVPRQPTVPVKRIVPIPSFYKTMGEKLNMCPYELRDILSHEFDDDDVLVMTLFKKFVTAAKISGLVDFTETKKTLREVEIRHQDEMKWYQESLDARQAEIARKAADFSSNQTLLTKNWNDLLIDLVQKIQRNPDIKSLGTLDYWMVKAIKVQHPKCVKIDKQDVATIDFVACQKIKPEDVQRLFSTMKQLQEQDAENKFLAKLRGDSLDALQQKLEEYSLNDDPRLPYVEDEISRRLGRNISKGYYDDPWDEYTSYYRHEEKLSVVAQILASMRNG
jgi:hypothetical protein